MKTLNWRLSSASLIVCVAALGLAGCPQQDRPADSGPTPTTDVVPHDGGRGDDPLGDRAGKGPGDDMNEEDPMDDDPTANPMDDNGDGATEAPAP